MVSMTTRAVSSSWSISSVTPAWAKAACHSAGMFLTSNPSLWENPMCETWRKSVGPEISPSMLRRSSEAEPNHPRFFFFFFFFLGSLAFAVEEKPTVAGAERTGAVAADLPACGVSRSTVL